MRLKLGSEIENARVKKPDWKQKGENQNEENENKKQGNKTEEWGEAGSLNEGGGRAKGQKMKGEIEKVVVKAYDQQTIKIVMKKN